MNSEYTGNDIYCDLIIPRKIDITIIKETDNVLALYHTRPSYQTHIIVIPKQHIKSLVDLSNSKLQLEILDIIREISTDVLEKTGEAKVITNMGNFQESKHLHFHIIAGQKI